MRNFNFIPIVLILTIFFGLNSFAQKKSIALTDSSTFIAKTLPVLDCYYFSSAEDASHFSNSRGTISEKTLLPLVSMYNIKNNVTNNTSIICKILYDGSFYYVPSAFLEIEKQAKDYLISKSEEGEKTREEFSFKTVDVIEKYKQAKADLETANQNLALALAKKAGLGINYYTIRQNENNIVDFDISLINYSKKTIKYAYVTIYGYNGVKDLVAKKTITLTGPSKFEAVMHHGEEQIFYSSVLCRVDAIFKLSIQIKYMDGSSKLYSGKTIDDITFAKSIEEDFKDD